MFTEWLVRQTIRDYQDTASPQVRARYAALEAGLGICVNFLLFAGKLALGIFLNSVALIGDGINQLSDCAISLIILFGFRLAGRPGDREHPFGHGRVESVVTLVLAVLVIVAGVEVLRDSVLRILEPEVRAGRMNWWIAVFLLFCILAKELMARFARRLGRMIRSDTLAADSWNHRSDVLATAGVLGSLWASQYGLQWMDGVGGILVAGVIMFTGYKIIREAAGPLIGESPPPELLARIEELARRTPGVQGVHDIIVHRYGQMHLVSLHIEVDQGAPVEKLHDLSEEVEDRIERELNASAVVHLDPIDRSPERYAEVEAALRGRIEAHPEISGFHDLRLVQQGGRLRVEFDLSLEKNVGDERARLVRRQLRRELHQRLPGLRIAIKVEPHFKYSR